METQGLLRRGRILCAALLARAARRRNDAKAYARHARRVLDLAAPAGGWVPDAAIIRTEPIIHTRGGFFACRILASDGARRFAKAVLASSREAMFWARWREGLVRTEGEFYSINPPSRLRLAGDVAVLVFPELEALETGREARGRTFRDNVDLVTRAIADFNSSHLHFGGGGFPKSRACEPLAVPSRSALRRSLGLGAASAGDVRRRLRFVEANWPQVRNRVYESPACLSHMDLGPGNFVLGDGLGILQDFGLAGMAPIGSDLHTIARYAVRLGGRTDKHRLVDVYAEVFAAKGVAVDRAAILSALDAHFAARYRNLALPSARKRPAFDAALNASLALTGGEGVAAGRPPQGSWR